MGLLSEIINSKGFCFCGLFWNLCYFPTEKIHMNGISVLGKKDFDEQSNYGY